MAYMAYMASSTTSVPEENEDSSSEAAQQETENTVRKKLMYPLLHCIKCRRIFNSSASLRRHHQLARQRDSCAAAHCCAMDHPHQIVEKFFTHHQQAIEWASSQDLDRYFSTHYPTACAHAGLDNNLGRRYNCREELAHRGKRWATRDKPEIRPTEKKICDSSFTISLEYHCQCPEGVGAANINCGNAITTWRLQGCLAHNHEFDGSQPQELPRDVKQYLLGLIQQDYDYMSVCHIAAENPDIKVTVTPVSVRALHTFYFPELKGTKTLFRKPLTNTKTGEKRPQETPKAFGKDFDELLGRENKEIKATSTFTAGLSRREAVLANPNLLSMAYHCTLCRKAFTCRSGVHSHKQTKVDCTLPFCKEEHEHQLVNHECKSMDEAQLWFKNQELDGQFGSVCCKKNNRRYLCLRSVKGKKVNYTYTRPRLTKTEDCNSQIVMRRAFLCHCTPLQKHINPLKCVTSSTVYLITGCIKHTHPIETTRQRVTSNQRSFIVNLLSQGVAHPEIKRLCNEMQGDDTTARAVSMRDIANFRRLYVDRPRKIEQVESKEGIVAAAEQQRQQEEANSSQSVEEEEAPQDSPAAEPMLQEVTVITTPDGSETIIEVPIVEVSQVPNSAPSSSTEHENPPESSTTTNLTSLAPNPAPPVVAEPAVASCLLPVTMSQDDLDEDKLLELEKSRMVKRLQEVTAYLRGGLTSRADKRKLLDELKTKAISDIMLPSVINYNNYNKGVHKPRIGPPMPKRTRRSPAKSVLPAAGAKRRKRRS